MRTNVCTKIIYVFQITNNLKASQCHDTVQEQYYWVAHMSSLAPSASVVPLSQFVTGLYLYAA